MKTRRHHNNTGYRQIKRGKTREQVKRMAKKLNTPVWNSERMAHEIKEHLIDSGKRGSLPSKKFLNKAKEYWSEKEIRKFLGVHEEYPLDIA